MQSVQYSNIYIHIYIRKVKHKPRLASTVLNRQLYLLIFYTTLIIITVYNYLGEKKKMDQFKTWIKSKRVEQFLKTFFFFFIKIRGIKVSFRVWKFERSLLFGENNVFVKMGFEKKSLGGWEKLILENVELNFYLRLWFEDLFLFPSFWL